MILKTVLITGASRGIGAAIAERFAEGGYHTYITCARDTKSLYTLQEKISSTYKVPCTAIPCDVSDYAAVEELFKSLPPLDVLINNAGISYFGLLSDMSVEDWHKVIDTNLNACFYTAKLAIPAMVRAKSGRILNISSVWGNAGSSLETAYSASKGGLNALTKALAKELAPSNIQVNALAPGLIDTAMNACLSEEDMDALKAEIPADRLGSPKEVADLAWQVVHAPAYMTGQIIAIDGGWL
ncbi:MAG: SDR family NAD(P)-dependent oxidoreductase [Lachnospiraceae bacterium]|nr:SDR family NAD(P)-dependent oxidoreductase [Lachnospiraceae bacterium]